MKKTVLLILPLILTGCVLPRTGLSSCSIYELKSWKEAGKPAPPIGQFPAITLYADPHGKTGGQTNWVMLDQPEIGFTLSLHDNKSQWTWATAAAGTIYLTVNGQDEKDATQVKWPRIALGSADDGRRNRVCVRGYSDDGQYADIVGIPQSGDYSAYTPGKYSWLFNTSYTVFPNGVTGGKELFLMPIFAPASGYQVSSGKGGLWIGVEWLYRKVGEFGGW